MKISIDTKEDSQDEIRKVIAMLQNIVGDSQQIFSNQPTNYGSQSGTTETSGSPFANIFGDTSSAETASSQDTSTSSPTVETKEEAEQTSESTEDLFAELFSEEELKKMEPVKEEEEIKPKTKKPSIEFY